MNLLCLSDLHLRSEAVVAAIDRKRLSPFLAQIAATVAEVSPDAVVVTGDTECLPQMRRFPSNLIQCQFSTVIVRSSCSCFSFGTFTSRAFFQLPDSIFRRSDGWSSGFLL